VTIATTVPLISSTKRFATSVEVLSALRYYGLPLRKALGSETHSTSLLTFRLATDGKGRVATLSPCESVLANCHDGVSQD
jgi:hypothetical protein